MQHSNALKNFGLLTVSLVAIGSLQLVGLSPVVAEIRRERATVTVALKNWGLINTEAKSHIQAPDAWTIEEGSRRVIVAVIDTGIDPHHKNLSSNLWQSQSPGKLKKVYGWNFTNDQPNPVDIHGHGTHVAGIIGAVVDPTHGISGVAHRVSIMPIKYYSESSTGAVNLTNTIKAIHFAIKNGAHIINYSGGGPEFSREEYEAIREAEKQGILFIAAAGNDHQNTDLKKFHYFPSAYNLSNIISVAATDIHNKLLPSSNWGKMNVDVAAPGEDILSTWPNNQVRTLTGTSQATAFVTGLAALLLSKDPTLTPPQVKNLIMTTVDRFPNLENKVATGGRVNAYRALLELQNRNLASHKAANERNVNNERIAQTPFNAPRVIHF